jgi:hypothetical protein
MPRATVSSEAIQIDLKSCEGGFVLIKQLPYHEMLVRRDRAARYSLDQQREGNRVDIEMLQAMAREYEFAHCIADHNLEDEHGKKLNFQNPMTLKILDPRVGEEIEEAIDKLHNREEDLELFSSPASTLSATPTEVTTTPSAA